ncbi:hypothetical protein N665_0230s0043 [Sinapis alba]|nr:hypothetical protein N665_0230s0043 [Sinapis alba]
MVRYGSRYGTERSGSMEIHNSCRLPLGHHYHHTGDHHTQPPAARLALEVSHRKGREKDLTGREERRERDVREEEKREKRSLTARVFDLREFSAELRFRFVIGKKERRRLPIYKR